MKYFSIEELAKSATAERLAIDNTPPRAARKMLTILVEQLLDPIRRRYGAPIIVTSGYRCPALNTAVGGVANSHHIVGCAADIKGTETPSNLPLYGEALQASLQNISGEHPEGAPHRGGAVQRTEGVCRGGAFNLALFHLIIQMQREGAIRFTQLIAEEGYRWLHISYVPGMLRNQVINVNDDDDVNVDDNCLPDGLKLQVALLGADKPAAVATDAKPRAETSLLNLCRGAKEGNFKLTDALFASASSLEKESTSASTLTLRDYQDSG